MSTNIRRNLLATITPQTTPPLRLVLATPLERITTTASGVIATLVGSGGVPGYAYSITAGALPSGTTLQTNGSILVTGALTIGDYRFTAQVQDSALTAFVHTFILRIVSRLTISPRNAYCTDTEQYAAYTYSFVARGATGTMSWALTSGSLPAGLSLSGAGDITGTTTTSSPPYAQSYFVVTGTDSGSGDTIVIPCSIIVYAQQTTPTGNFVPDGWLLNGYNGGNSDIPAIVQGKEWFSTFTWDQYAPGPVTMVCNPAYMQVYLSRMQPGIPGTVVVGLKPEQTAALSVGLTSFQIYVQDAFGAQLVSLNIFVQVVAPPVGEQLGIQPQKNSVDVGSVAPYKINFTGAAVGSVSNSGGVLTVDFPSYGGVLSVGVTAPLATTGGVTPTLSIPVATSGQNGYLSSANWTTFNSKVTSVGASGALASSGGVTPVITHNNSGVAANTYAYPVSITVNAFGHVTAITAGSAPSVAWGGITGTLSAQTDLQSALNAKAKLAGGNSFTGTQYIASITLSGTLTLPGTTGQYVRGNGSLATFPTIPGGTVTSVAAGNGMNFSTIAGTGTVTLGTPTTLTASTTNSASGTTHTHAITGFLPLTGGTLTGTLTGTTIQGTTVRETSDASIKSEVRDLRGGLDAIRHLVPVRFFNELSAEHEVGFIAQDVRKVLPEVVHTDDDGLLSLSYQRLVAPIVAALQEMDARMKRLESKL